jgi:threonine dehydrogenase-like Zn-dependent dehydrogenase
MAKQMLAVVKDAGKTQVRQVPTSELRDPQELIVRVMKAGICRTDLLAAGNEIDTAPTLVLGHEFSGVIEAVGKNPHRLKEGDRVTVNPIGPCRRCERCQAGDATNCMDPAFVGLQQDGGFAEYVRLAQAAVVKLPAKVSFLEGAYAEPIAAGLAVLKAGIRPEEKGLICGTNRIAKLIQRLLFAHGFRSVECVDAAQGPRAAPGQYDFAIETDPTPQDFAMMLQAIRRRGKLILRSRVHRHVEFPLQAALHKEPVLHVVNYAPFEETVGLLASHAVELADLFGRQYPLGSFAEAFADARNGEAKKLFLAIGPE